MASDDTKADVPGSPRGCPVRRFPLRLPENHKPPIARYSAAVTQAGNVAVLFLGLQSRAADELAEALAAFRALQCDDAPIYSDQASFTDERGYLNRVIALYWLDTAAFGRWAQLPQVRKWRRHASRNVGISWEPVVLDARRMETISFSEFRRGFSGCPGMNMEPTIHSGYFGAARDRIPAAADDAFEATAVLDASDSAGDRSYFRVQPPENMAVIRSGVSWAACEGDQLKDYQERIRPKLDAGMEYLRKNPQESGCYSLRQVTGVDGDEKALAEGYSLGFFVSLEHLERWAKNHPTHLAIYARAIAARKKYQDALQLRTYNEIFVVQKNNPPFEYFNCHPDTGLLPRMFQACPGDA